MDIFPDYESYFSLIEKERREDEAIMINLKALYVVLVQRRWDLAKDLLRDIDGTYLAKCKKTDALLCDDDIQAPVDIVELICATDPKQATFQNPKRHNGRNPLMKACLSAPTDVVLVLMDIAPQTLEMTDNQGDLPFHYGLLERRSPKILTKMLSIYPNAAFVDPSFDVIGEWEHELLESLPDYRDLPQVHHLDDDIDAVDRMKETFNLLTEIHVFRTVNYYNSSDHHRWFPVHEAMKIEYVPPVCQLFLLRTMNINERTKHDEDGNFLLHNVATNKGWIDYDNDDDDYSDNGEYDNTRNENEDFEDNDGEDYGDNDGDSDMREIGSGC